MMRNGLREALGWLSGQRSAMEKDLEALVTSNSFTDDRDRVNECGAVLERVFAPTGLVHKRQSSLTFGDHHLFLTRSALEHGATTLLIGHLDTVFPPRTFEGFWREGDRLRGPGVLDMKGGLVVVAYAMRALREVGLLDALRLGAVVVSDEEVGSPEGQSVIARAATSATEALVFESGRKNDAIVIERKGVASYTVTAKGKAAHAGNNHADGCNAIWGLAVFVDRVQRLTDPARGVTINVGKISGGTAKNTVPDNAVAEVDVRFVTPQDGLVVQERIGALAREAETEVPGVLLDVERTSFRTPLEATDRSRQLAERYARAAVEEGLGGTLAPRVGGGSDACTTHALGIASIDALGPRGEGFHTRDEYIDATTLVPKTRALVRFLLA